MKAAILAVMLFGLASASFGQTCVTSWVSGSPTERITLTGTSVTSGLGITGGGTGEWASIPGLRAGYGYQVLASGDQTITSGMNAPAGGTTPEAGIEVTANANWKFLMRVNNGAVYFDKGKAQGITETWTNVGSHTLSGGNYGLKFVFTAATTTLTAYISPANDGNYISLGSITTVQGLGQVLFFVDSGDLTNPASVNFSSPLINGSSPVLTYNSGNSGVSGGMTSGLVTQPGNLDVTVTNTAGSITNNGGCGNVAQFFGAIFIVDTTTGLNDGGSGALYIAPSNSNCTSGCSFTQTINNFNAVTSRDLVHGDVYTVTVIIQADPQFANNVATIVFTLNP
jgi:hypothetical protein